MGKISKRRRQFIIKRRQKRKKKIKRFKEEYQKAKSKGSKDEIINKVKKIAPLYPIKDVLKEKDKKTS